MKVKIPKAYSGPPWLMGGFLAFLCFALSVTLVSNENYFWGVIFAVFGLWLTFLSYRAIAHPWEEYEEEEEAVDGLPEDEEFQPAEPSAEERAIRNIMDRPH